MRVRHQLEPLGAWGSIRASAAAYRCRRCGGTYFFVNYADDPVGRLTPLGADVIGTPGGFEGGCMAEDLS